MTTVLWILALLAALAVSVFAVQNAQPVDMRFLGWHALTSLPVVIFIAAALGAILTGLLAGVSLVRTRRTLRHLRDEVASLRGSARPETAVEPAQGDGKGNPAG